MVTRSSKADMEQAPERSRSDGAQRRRKKIASLLAAESTLHCIEVLGCIFSTVSAVTHGEVHLALWSLSALLTSVVALYLLHSRKEVYLRVREWMYAGMRVHRAFAIVGMRRVLKKPPLPQGVAQAAGDRVYFAKALLVNSSILPILLQSVVLQLQLPLQAAVQVAVASIILRATPAYCASLVVDGVQPAQFRWLAAVQAKLAAVVMAATTSSRGAPSPSEVPCIVSLTHLVLVFEVIVPTLFVYFYDTSASSWGSSSSGAGSGGGSGSGGSRATGSMNSSAGAREASNGAAVAATASSSSTGRAGAAAAPAPAAAVGVVANAGGSGAGAGSSAQLPRGRQLALSGRQQHAGGGMGYHGRPSPHLLLLFGLGVSGVLFDVLCTMHTHLSSQ